MTRRRLAVVVAALATPVAFLSFGVLGSFTWTFPAVALWCELVRPDAVRSLGLRRGRLGVSLLLGSVFGVALGVACGEALRALGIAGISTDLSGVGLPFADALARQGLAGMNLAEAATGPARLALYYLYYVALVGLGEELFWRGLVQQELRRRWGVRRAIVVAGLAFGSIHCFLLLVVPLGPGLAFLALISAGGIVWGAMFEKTGNVWGIAISHGITSATIWRFYFFAPGP